MPTAALILLAAGAGAAAATGIAWCLLPGIILAVIAIR